jgi:hypothetical protein
MSISIIDKLSSALSPMMRSLQDLKVGTLLGTGIKVLRISVSTPDVMGETTETLSTSVMDNVIINHPYGGKVQIFETYSNITQQINTGSIDIWDVLPISMQVLFSGTFSTEAVSIKRGDLIIEILKDDLGNKLPLVMQVEKIFGSFLVKNMVGRNYELSLYRGQLSSSIQSALNTFLTVS